MRGSVTQGRVAFLDGIRGVAIACVLVVHWGIHYLPVGHGGYVGVDVFFVLSGFVITRLLWRADMSVSSRAAFGVFLRRRAVRLYPALLGLVVVGGGVYAALPWSRLDDAVVLRNAVASALQLSWVVELSGETSEPFRQTWSLGIEWVFYLTWPLVVFAARRRGVSAGRLAGASAVAAGLLWLGCLLLVPGDAFYFVPPSRSAQILVGGALALRFLDHPPRRVDSRAELALTGASVVALAGFVLLGPGPFEGAGGRLVGSPLATLTALLLVRHAYVASRGPLHAVLGGRLVSGLGRVSYSLYLWHWLPLYVMDRDEMGLPAPVLGLLGVALAALLTALSYRLLEVPFLGSRSDALAPSVVLAGSVEHSSDRTGHPVPREA